MGLPVVLAMTQPKQNPKKTLKQSEVNNGLSYSHRLGEGVEIDFPQVIPISSGQDLLPFREFIQKLFFLNGIGGISCSFPR